MALSKINSNAIENGAVTSDDLASTLNLTGKTVTLPSGTGGKVLGISNITHDTTPQNYSAVPNNFGVSTIYYVNAAKRSVSYTKQSSSSTLVVFYNYSYRTNGAGNGSHTVCVYADENPSSIYKVSSFDIQRVANGSASASAFSGAVPFTGLASGSYTFNVVPCRRSGPSDAMSLGINGYSSSDQSDGSTWIYVMEIQT